MITELKDTKNHPVYELIMKLPLVQTWPDLSDQLDKIRTTIPLSWTIPEIFCQEMVGNQIDPTPATAALGLSQLAIMLIDDLLDEDPRGLQHQIGIGRAANLASALQSLGLTILENTPLSTSLRKAAIHRLNSMLAITAYGQELDTRNPHDEVSYWELVHYKSTPFYAASFALGAVFAEKTARQIDHYHALGVLYGEMIQIHDDLKDSLENPANPDWIQGRNPLPILFAGTVDHPDRAHFLSLRASITEPGHLYEAQDILVRCGAVSYCLDQLLARYEQARDQLKTLDAPTSAWHLFDELVEPMKELLEVGEMPLPPILNLVGQTA